MKFLTFSLLLLLAASCGQRARPVAEVRQSASNLPEILFADSLPAGTAGDTIDMGRIRAGEKVRYDLLLHNDLDRPMLILSVSSSCGCTAVEFSKAPIPPGERAPFSFTFDSQGFNGFQLKTITLHTTTGGAPRQLVLTGEVF